MRYMKRFHILGDSSVLAVVSHKPTRTQKSDFTPANERIGQWQLKGQFS